VQRHVAGREGVGPAQRAHRDVLRGPVADAGQLAQRPLITDRAGHRHDGTGALPDQAARGEFGRVAVGQARGRGKDPSGARAGAVIGAVIGAGVGVRIGVRIDVGAVVIGRTGKRCAEAPRQPAGQGVGRSHAHLLAEHRAHRQLEPVEGARHANARCLRGQCAQAGGHRRRLAVEVKEPPQPRLQRYSHGGQRGVQAHPQHAAGGIGLHAHPAGMLAPAGSEPHCPAVALRPEGLHARDQPPREESGDEVPVVGRLPGQFDLARRAAP